MGYALISYDEPEELVAVANLAKLAIYREVCGALRDKLWFVIFNEGTTIVHETTAEPQKIDDAVKSYTVAIPVLRGGFEWVK